MPIRSSRPVPVSLASPAPTRTPGLSPLPKTGQASAARMDRRCPRLGISGDALPGPPMIYPVARVRPGRVVGHDVLDAVAGEIAVQHLGAGPVAGPVSAGVDPGAQAADVDRRGQRAVPGAGGQPQAGVLAGALGEQAGVAAAGEVPVRVRRGRRGRRSATRWPLRRGYRRWPSRTRSAATGPIWRIVMFPVQSPLAGLLLGVTGHRLADPDLVGVAGRARRARRAAPGGGVERGRERRAEGRPPRS